jgi:4-aminobutyrate aminotransferase-like enzyme
VQVGFGRVGSHFWAFETQGIVPDIVTMGKPIGNGHPIGAVVTRVGLAVLDVIRDESLQERALEVGMRLRSGLARLADRHEVVGDVRGVGLFIGVELVSDREVRAPAGKHASHLVERMRDHGILLSTDGPDHNVIKIKPPLVFGVEDADRLVAVMDRVLEEEAFRLPGRP